MGWALTAPILVGLLFVGQAYLLARVLDAFIRLHQPIDALWNFIFAIAGVMIIRALLLWSGQRAASRAVEEIKQELRLQIFSTMLQRGPAWTKQTPSGGLSSVLIEQVEALDGYLRNFMPAMYAAALLPIVFTLAVLPTDWIVALLFIVSAPLIPMFMALIGWGAEAVNKKHQTVLSQLSGVFGDRIRGLFTLSLFGRTEAEIQAVKQANDSLNRATMGVLRIAFISSAVLELFAALGVAGVAVYIGFSYLGAFGEGFSGYSLQHGLFCLLIAPEVYNPLRQLAAGYHERATAKAAVEQIEELLGTLPAAPTAAADAPASDLDTAEASLSSALGAPVENLSRQSNVRDPSFAADAPAEASSAALAEVVIKEGGPLVEIKAGRVTPPDSEQPLLENLNLSLHADEHVALMGPSGSGKTSFLEILMGLRRPAAGQWLYGRQGLEDARALGQEITPHTLLISQQPFLTMGTVRALLCLANEQADDAALWQALERAQAADFIRALPQGLDTELGTRGFGLSGGQAHRVALARLFLADPQLVLLDEPTAHLDPQTRDEVMAEIQRFCVGRGLIVATHDPDVARRLPVQWAINEQQIVVCATATKGFAAGRAGGLAGGGSVGDSGGLR